MVYRSEFEIWECSVRMERVLIEQLLLGPFLNSESNSIVLGGNHLLALNFEKSIKLNTQSFE